MYSKTWIERSPTVEPPMIGSVNFQVRTGVSAPFEPHMTGQDETPSVSSVNFQVRTGVSASFDPHMTGDDSAEAEASEQVRVPAADFMVNDN